MEKIKLGRTNLMVSRIGFGGIPIQRVSEDEALVVVRKSLELGVNFFDTANGYTTSEERIGKAISGQRDGLVLATKTHAKNQDEVEKHIELSLKRLGVESIDLYQFHNVADSDSLMKILAPEGGMVAVEAAKKAGIIKYIGVSSHSMEMAKVLVKTDRFDTIMFPLNFIASEPADELLPLIRERNIGFIGMKPLGGGMLDNIELALKFFSQFPEVVPLIGIEKVCEIEEIAAHLKCPLKLTDEDCQEIERLRQELGNRFCRRCDYCQPCTEEIPISHVMNFPSLFKRLPPTRVFSEANSDRMEKAANCCKCGDCEERCPYHLPIREKLAEYVNIYREEKGRYDEQIASR